MNWAVRHEGSPQSVQGLTEAQVLQGLLDGQWEPTDEARGPDDTNWVALEAHPRFAEVAADIEPPPPRVYDDETRLDMNALIDVTLVLLIFFILTTTYANLAKLLRAARPTSPDGVAIVGDAEVKEKMIHVVVRQQDNRSVISIGGKEIETVVNNPKQQARVPKVGEALKDLAVGDRRTLLLEYDDKVPHGVLVAIQDVAKTARIDRVEYLQP